MKQLESQDSSTRKRSDRRLNSKLEKSLMTYVAAASAAGVGMLTTTPAAEAKIVYTPAHVTVSVGTNYALDVNHDGIIDFYLVPNIAVSIGGSSRVSYLSVCHADVGFGGACVQSASSVATNKDNVVRILSSGAAALAAGSKIAHGEKFANPGVAVLMAARDYFSGSRTTQNWKGPWANGGKGTNNRYLGFKFKINGEFHYGWARLTVHPFSHANFTATLTGYAYETIPNKGIVAGQTSGTAELSSMNSGAPVVPAKEGDGPSLGSLALGAPGLSIWRREEDGLN